MLRENISLCSPVEQRMTVKWFDWDLKICPKFQVFISHFSKVLDLLNEHKEKLCEEKILQLQSISNQCYNMY